jgi:hypothetical protein
MSYTTKQRNDAILLIGDGSLAPISTPLYADLEKFNWIKLMKVNGLFASATLTYSGKDLFQRLKKSDDYVTTVQKEFSRLFNDISFQFQRIYYTDKELSYYVNFNNNGHNTEFKMYMKEADMWIIENVMLPAWVYEMEMEFSEAIISNERNTNA